MSISFVLSRDGAPPPGVDLPHVSSLSIKDPAAASAESPQNLAQTVWVKSPLYNPSPQRAERRSLSSSLPTIGEPLKLVRSPSVEFARWRRPVMHRTLDAALDTDAAHEQARLAAKHKDRDSRYKDYTCLRYGSESAKAAKNTELRTFLLSQMRMKETGKQLHERLRRTECLGALATDAAFVLQERTIAHDHAVYLTQFRDSNKELIAEREQRARDARQHVQQQERQQLQLDPVNWSKTLV